MDKIVLRRMEFYGYHGVFSEEQALGQRFYIDLELLMDLKTAGSSDNLEHTINYAEIANMVKNIVEGRKFKLVEALAESIASTLLETYTKVNELRVKVIKPHPPVDIHFDGVSIEIHRKRV
jgi:dihydroneopterin aldolase